LFELSNCTLLRHYLTCRRVCHIMGHR